MLVKLTQQYEPTPQKGFFSMIWHDIKSTFSKLGWSLKQNAGSPRYVCVRKRQLNFGSFKTNWNKSGQIAKKSKRGIFNHMYLKS